MHDKIDPLIHQAMEWLVPAWDLDVPEHRGSGLFEVIAAITEPAPDG